MDVHKDLDEYTGTLVRQKRVLEEAKKRRGQRPRDRKDRDVILFEFVMASAATSAKIPGSGTHLMRSSFVPPAYPPCITPLDHLNPIMIADLRLETHHRGSYLLLRAVASPNRMTGILVPVEDERREVAILQLYQQEDEDTRPAKDVVKDGSVLLLKEPFFKVMASGEYGLRVDHLSDVLYLDTTDPRVPQSWRPKRVETGISANSLKLKGNDCVGRGQYWRAIKVYSSALSHSPTPQEIEVIKRNRSLAHLRTKQYDAALCDTGFPDFSQPASEKALFRAAQALYHLGRFEECCSVLEKLCSQSPDSKDATQALNRARRGYAESKTGTYDFGLLQAEAKKSRPPHLDHATYVGPVEVREAKGKGRGLFTTKAVEAGDLILCEKAFSHAYVDEVQDSNASVTFLMNTETDTIFMGGQADLIRLITQKIYKNPSLASAFTALHHGAYTPVDVHSVDGQPVVDSFLVERTMALNVFGCPLSSLHSHKDVVSHKRVEKTAYNSCGIWITASYINHSCTGNARRSFIGDMMIIRATRPIPSGTELSFPYVAPSSSSTTTNDASTPAKKFKSWDFICTCSICADTKATPTSTVQKRRSLLAQFKNLCDSSPTPLSNLPAEKLQRLLTALNNTYTRPAHHVPRLPLFDSHLLLTRVHMDRCDFVHGLDAVAQTLQALGFVITGCDYAASTPFEIETWGHLLDHIVEVFLHARGAFGGLGLVGKAGRADGFARLAFRVLVGEEESFDVVYESWG